MFNFTTKLPVATTVATATLNPTFTFSSATASQPFIFGNNVQNTSTTPANFTSTGFTGTSIFGTNQTAPVTQTISVFGSNLTGTTIKFDPVSAQATFPIASTKSNIFGNNNTTTTTASPFGTTMVSTPSNIFNQPFPTGPTTSTTPFIFGKSTASTINPVPMSTSTIANPFVFQPVTTQSPFNLTTNTNTSTLFKFGSQSNASTNIFPPSTIATSSDNTASTNVFAVPNWTTTSTFPTWNSTAPASTTSSIFHVPTATTTSTASSLNNTTTTTTASPFKSQLFTGLPVSQPQSTQAQNTEQSASIIQQQYLAASLLDPYANRGKKDFTNIDHISIPTESPIVSTISTTTSTTTVTTSTPIPIILPIQSNTRKIPSSRSVVDVNFKLKPVSSSPILNDDINPPNQPSTTSIKEIKSTLTGNCTDEEEIILLSRTKMSKLRLSNDILDSSYQPDSVRSLYPIRRLAELEKLNNITPPSTPSRSSPTTTINNERISHTSNKSRDASPNLHSTSSTIIPKQSSSPIIPRKSTNNFQPYQLPILTRDNYYMKPSSSELKSLFNDKGQCILKQFTVGHEIYGSVTFYGNINVAGLNLDEIIEINRHEVIVYPNDENKPPIGEELNIPARITLIGVYPIDRTTHEEIKDSERIKASNYNDYLREITKKFDGEFINYGIHDGSWTFMVKHFTR